MATVTICSNFGAQNNKVWHCFHCFPIYFPGSDGTRCHDLSFLMLSFKPAFSLSSFTFIKRLFSFCHKSGVICLSEVIYISDININNHYIEKIMVFPVVMYECESWTIKKAEHWRIDAFELWCWRRLLRVPWTARRSNQSILKEISPEYSLEGLMIKIKLQYFGHLMWRTDSLEKTLMLGRDWRQ